MSLAFPVVIPAVRTINVGQGQQLARQTFERELELQSLADVRALIRNTTREQATQQTQLGNPPQVIVVDGMTNKDVQAVDKKTVVLYGTVLAQVAMRLVEMALAAAIDATTTAHSGRLRSVASAWGWIYVPKGGAARPVSSGARLPSFAAGDMLALMPRGVPHATMANRNVAASGRLSVAPKKGRAANPKLQNVGFLATATRALRSKAVFKQFAVYAQFTKAHMVAGELMTRKQGTGYIVIRPRRRYLKVKV